MHRLFNTMIVFFVLLFAFSVVADEPTIVLDGEFDDWSGIKPAVSDPTGDASTPSMIDFGDVRVTSTPNYAHLFIELGNTINIQRLDGTAQLLLDCDDDQTSGKRVRNMPGVDVIVSFSPRDPEQPNRPGRGIGLRSVTYTAPEVRPDAQLDAYDIDFAFAPTYADDRVECRLKRGADLPETPPFLVGESFSFKLVYRSKHGTIADQTEIVSAELVPHDKSSESAHAADADALTRADGTDLRVLSWNAQYGAIFEKTDNFSRVIRAGQADLVLFQELSHQQNARDLQQFFKSHVDGEANWRVLYGRGGGDLRCGIVSRVPIEPVAALDMIPYPGWPDREIRAMGGLVHVNDQRVLVVSLHLKCCGRAGSEEDQKRVLEVNAIRDAVSEALENIEKPDAIILAGDFNLVGSRKPLDVLIDDFDLDDSDLAVVPTLQPDGASHITWHDSRMPFVPGRLDYMVFSNSTLSRLKSFSMDTRDLPKSLRRQYNLQRNDSLSASDHFPLIADFKFKQ